MSRNGQGCSVAVIWIDWYAYHVARFRGLEASPVLTGRVAGIELVGGIGVHAGLKFREELPAGLAVKSLMPESNWAEASKPALARRLWDELERLDPQVVLVPGYYTLPAIAAALWARSHGRESVLMTESTAFDHVRVARKELLKMLVIRSLFGWAVAGGKAHVAYLRQLGFPEHRIVGRYDVVDNATISEGVSLAQDGGEPPCGLTRPYFLYVGRLSEEKNVGALLESWEAYRREGGTWPLILVGDGPERERLRDRAARSIAPEEVFLAGLKSSCEVIPFYAFAGCFVLPSSREPWGLVVNEAMAAGLPVLVSNRCGCCADLVEEGSNGMTFDPHDGAAIARQLHAVEQLTEEQRRRMGQRSRERIDSYTPRAFGDSVASILEASGKQASLRTVSEAS